MPVQDTNQLKEKIISMLKSEGPNLPVHIAKKIEQNLLFTSAFLSELVSEKRIKMSHMRIGSSPLYFLDEQEPMLEKFSSYLKSREKDAFFLLKEKKFLDDSRQEPAIRVALREIKDFAVPFKINEGIIWRFFTMPELEFSKQAETQKAKEEIISIKPIKEKLLKKAEESLDIFNSESEFPESKKKKPKKIQKKNKISRKGDKFLDKVRSFLNEKSTEITDILGFGKNELVLKIRERDAEEKIIIAYNKRKINENDIIRASKKASEFNLPYVIVSLGEPLKKINEFVSASKNLHSFEKLK